MQRRRGGEIERLRFSLRQVATGYVNQRRHYPTFLCYDISRFGARRLARTPRSTERSPWYADRLARISRSRNGRILVLCLSTLQTQDPEDVPMLEWSTLVLSQFPDRRMPWRTEEEHLV